MATFLGSTPIADATLGGTNDVAALRIGSQIAWAASGATFPIGRNGHFFTKADGTHFQVMANTVWNATMLTQPEFQSVVAASKADNFNTLLISVLPVWEIVTTIQDGYNHYPFVGDATPTVTSGAFPVPKQTGVATSNPASGDYDYWDHVQWIVDYCASQDVYCVLVPCFQGYQGRSWRGYMTTTNMATYGTFLGTLLGSRSNIMWMLGGDNSPVGDVAGPLKGPANTGDVVTANNNLANAIIAASAVPPLMTYHMTRNASPAAYATPVTHFGAQSWFTVYPTYTNTWTWQYVEDDYARTPAKPTLLVEAMYEDRAGAGLNTPHLLREELRAQSAWAYLSGGYPTYGDEYVIRVDGYDWALGLTRAAQTDHAVLYDLMAPFGLQLVPDVRAAGGTRMLTAGEGNGGTDVSSVGLSAVRSDGTYGLAYFLGTRSPITVNLAKFNLATVQLAWIHTETGAATVIGTFNGEGTTTVTYPAGRPDAYLRAIASGTPVVVPGAQAVSDSFTGASAAVWTEHDPSGVATFSEVSGNLRCTIVGTGNYDLSGGVSTAPMYLQAHEGDFDIIMPIPTAINGTSSAFRGVMLVACEGAAGDHVKVSTYDTSGGPHRISFSRRVGGVVTDWYNSTPAGFSSTPPLYLGLRKVGSLWSAFYGYSAGAMVQFGGSQTLALDTTHVGPAFVTAGSWTAEISSFDVAGHPE
jgi:hypothetical protein